MARRRGGLEEGRISELLDELDVEAGGGDDGLGELDWQDDWVEEDNHQVIDVQEVTFINGIQQTDVVPLQSPANRQGLLE